MRNLAKVCLHCVHMSHVIMHWMCASVLSMCEGVHLCVFLPVFGPLKSSCRGRGGREDNGSRHYLLLSCRLSIRPHTLWPSQTRTASECTCTHALTRRMHIPKTHWHTRLCRDDLHTCKSWSDPDTKSHTPTHSHTQMHAEHTKLSQFLKVEL